MNINLPDGLYPFIDERFPLAEFTIIEAPAALEKLIREQAKTNGIEIVRGLPVELEC